jgi:hypothetical protein
VAAEVEAQEAVEAEAKLRRLSAQLAEAEAELAEAEAGGAAGEKVHRDPVRIEAARRAAEVRTNARTARTHAYCPF